MVLRLLINKTVRTVVEKWIRQGFEEGEENKVAASINGAHWPCAYAQRSFDPLVQIQQAVIESGC